MNLQNQINYLKNFHDADMFDLCTVPFPLDMARVRGAIIMRCGLLTPLYSEPLVQQAATQQFFYENQWNFEHIIKILEAEYSPIENVAEWKTETANHSGSDTETINRSRSEVHAGTDKNVVQESGTTTSAESGTTTNAESGTTTNAESGTTTNAESGTTTDTREISAENATTYQADNKSSVQHGKSDTITHGKSDTTTHGKTDTVTHGKTDSVTHGKKTDDTTTYGEQITYTDKDSHVYEKGTKSNNEFMRHGNIGVTTNQRLINEELDLLERFNPYKFIADLYEKELMLGLY